MVVNLRVRMLEERSSQTSLFFQTVKLRTVSLVNDSGANVEAGKICLLGERTTASPENDPDKKNRGAA
jgi:hypothetical protein